MAPHGENDGAAQTVATAAERRRWMGVLARAAREELEAAWARLPEKPAYEHLRGPETGLVMVRGRVGGTGKPFNLGEMTVTRCTLRLAGGATGHAHVAGRDRRRAELAAVFDALMQLPGEGARMAAAVISELAEAQVQRRALMLRKAAATRVEFFTMARGDNP